MERPPVILDKTVVPQLIPKKLGLVTSADPNQESLLLPSFDA